MESSDEDAEALEQIEDKLRDFVTKSDELEITRSMFPRGVKYISESGSDFIQKYLLELESELESEQYSQILGPTMNSPLPLFDREAEHVFFEPQMLNFRLVSHEMLYPDSPRSRDAREALTALS